MARHLAWLDAEIARSAPPASPAGTSSAPTTRHRALPDHPVLHLDDDELLARFSSPADQAPIISKTGCWLIFSALLLISLGGLALGIYIVYR